MYKKVDYLVCTLKYIVFFNFHLFRAADKIEPTKRPEEMTTVAKEWGRINAKHADIYVKNELKRDPNEVRKEFLDFYKNRRGNFLKIVNDYMKHG